ncbi:hypothetical protein QQF64_021166, partial [Cirrhinus molitorella]
NKAGKRKHTKPNLPPLCDSPSDTGTVGSRTQARCVLPVPFHPAGDLQMERDWCLCVASKCGGAGYSRSSLEHTQVLFFYPSHYITPGQHPQSGFPSILLSDGAGLIISSSTVPGENLLGHCFFATHRNCTFHPA